MVTDKFIEENKTGTLLKGDKVVMVNCHEASIKKNQKVWICKTDSYKDKGGQECVFLDGFSGCFFVRFLSRTK
jgi:hypothetical protein